MDGVNGARQQLIPMRFWASGATPPSSRRRAPYRRLAKRHHPDVQAGACGRTGCDASTRRGDPLQPGRARPVRRRSHRAWPGGRHWSVARRQATRPRHGPRGARGRLRHLQPAPTYHRRMSRPIPPMSGYGRGSRDDRDRPRCIVALFVGLLPFPLFDLRYSSLRGQSSGASRIATDAPAIVPRCPGKARDPSAAPRRDPPSTGCQRNAAGSTSRPGRVIRALDVRPGMLVGDLGPGVGHFTFRLARAVEPAGVVYALDASQRTLDELMGTADEEAITTLRTIKVPRDRLQVLEPVISLRPQRPPPPCPTDRITSRRRAFISSPMRRSSRVTTRGFAGSVVPACVIAEPAAARDGGRRDCSVATHDIVRGYFFGLFEVAADPARASK